MPSIGHFATGVLVGCLRGGATHGARVRAAVGYGALANSPDLDVVGPWLGFRDGGPFGHRGFTHSLLFAVAAALVAAAVTARRAPAEARRTGIAVLLALGSHGVLDALNFDGGGVAWLWPLTEAQFVIGWALLPSAPKGLDFATLYGASVVAFELVYFLPVMAGATVVWRRSATRPASPRASLAVTAAALSASVLVGQAMARWTPALAMVEAARGPALLSAGEADDWAERP